MPDPSGTSSRYSVICLRDTGSLYRVTCDASSLEDAARRARAHQHTVVLIYDASTTPKEENYLLHSLRAAPSPDACPRCGYSLAGLDPDEDGLQSCPECGLLLNPVLCKTIFARPPERLPPEHGVTKVLSDFGIGFAFLQFMFFCVDMRVPVFAIVGLLFGLKARARSNGQFGKAAIILSLIAGAATIIRHFL